MRINKNGKTVSLQTAKFGLYFRLQETSYWFMNTFNNQPNSITYTLPSGLPFLSYQIAIWSWRVVISKLQLLLDGFKMWVNLWRHKHFPRKKSLHMQFCVSLFSHNWQASYLFDNMCWIISLDKMFWIAMTLLDLVCLLDVSCTKCMYDLVTWISQINYF